MKAAFSDALKRAAVAWGCGRYLYELPSQWVDYDPQKRQLVGTPRLPDWAIPRKQAAAKAPAESSPPRTAPAQSAQQAQDDPLAWCWEGLGRQEAKLVQEGVCEAGELLAAIRHAATENRAGWDKDGVRQWVDGWADDRRSRLPATTDALLLLEDEMHRTGEPWHRVAEHLRLPKGAPMQGIDRSQCDEAVRALKTLPDKPPEKARKAKAG